MTRPLTLISASLIGLLLLGCTTGPSSGWHPASKADMELLIGQTVVKAIHQYRVQLLKHQQQQKAPQPRRAPQLRMRPRPLNQDVE